MPKTYSVKAIHTFNPLQFVMDGEDVVGFTVSVELNMGSFGITQQLDLWDKMNEQQRQTIQSLHDKIAQALNDYYLGDV